MSTFLEVLKPTENKRFFVEHILQSRNQEKPTEERVDEVYRYVEKTIIHANNIGLFGTEIRLDDLDFHQYAFGSEELNRLIRTSTLVDANL